MGFFHHVLALFIAIHLSLAFLSLPSTHVLGQLWYRYRGLGELLLRQVTALPQDKSSQGAQLCKKANSARTSPALG